MVEASVKARGFLASEVALDVKRSSSRAREPERRKFVARAEWETYAAHSKEVNALIEKVTPGVLDTSGSSPPHKIPSSRSIPERLCPPGCQRRPAASSRGRRGPAAPRRSLCSRCWPRRWWRRSWHVVPSLPASGRIVLPHSVPHNPKIVGSNPAPATKCSAGQNLIVLACFLCRQVSRSPAIK